MAEINRLVWEKGDFGAVAPTRPSAWFCLRARRLARGLAATSRRGLMTAPATATAMRGHHATSACSGSRQPSIAARTY